MREQPGYICWTGETGTADPYQEAQLALAECRQSCRELIKTKYSQSELPDIVKLYGGIQVNTIPYRLNPILIMNRILSLTLSDSSIISVSQMEDSLHLQDIRQDKSWYFCFYTKQI